MRIVYLLTSVGMGGAERQALTLAGRMAERGHVVQVVSLRRLAEEWPSSVPVVHLDMRRSPISAATGLLRARRMLRQLQPDVIHSHCFHANVFARALHVSIPGPALISTVHNVYEGGWRRMTAYRMTDRLSTLTTTVSAAVARRFIALKAVSPKRCKVVPNAIEMRDYTPDAQRAAAMRTAMGAGGEFVWLAAGRIAAAKDYPNLLRAFARVCAAQPQTRLWIAGENRLGAQEPLLRLAAELGISDCLRWLGLRRDLPALADAADAFVSSSAWEGMPLAVAEAMAMEKPIVATDAGGVGELVGDAGRLVAAQDTDALAAVMMAVMREPAASRQAMGRAARERVTTRLSMERRAAEWEEIYRGVSGSTD